MTSFNREFWGDDVCSTEGFDTVCSQLQNGRELCKSIEDYLKQRSKMEEDYGKALIKLAHTSTVTNVDETSLLSSWRFLRQQTEELGQSHIKLSRAFSEQQARLSTLMMEQKRYRKPVEDELRKLQISKRDAFRKLTELKKNYHKRCRESDLHDKLTSGTMVLKEREKMQTKQFKLVTQADLADKSYSESVESMNIVLNEWELKMNEYLIKAEELETNRIIALRNEMWEHCNFVSITCVYDDDCCEKVRKTLEGCSEVRDMRDFILQHSTGTLKPQYLHYENYYLSMAERVPPLSTV